MPKSTIEILRDDLDSSRAVYDAAKYRFAQVTTQTSAGNAGDAEEMQRTADAIRAHAQAIVAYTKALTRFNDFLLYGTVPDDLRSE